VYNRPDRRVSRVIGRRRLKRLLALLALIILPQAYTVAAGCEFIRNGLRMMAPRRCEWRLRSGSVIPRFRKAENRSSASRSLGPRSGRVLIVSQATVNGVAICVRDLVQAAVSGGYQVTVACPSNGDLPAWVRERGASWEPLEMRRSPHPGDLLAVMRIRRLARTQGLVHAHSSKAGVVGRLAVASLGRRRPPVVFTPHGWSWLVGGRLAPVYRQTERIMLPLATAVVAVSAEERAHGQAILGPQAAGIKVNANGVDVSRFSPEGPVADRPDDPLIVCVGRLCHQRAPDVAIAALALMRTPSVRLRLVGDGEDRVVIENLVSAMNLDGRVEFTGFRPDPAPDLRAADVVVIPSRYDGMALILLEAMACGAAIVATRVAGSSALNGAGRLVPADDPESLAEAVDALLADPGERRLLGAAARQRVVEHYSLQHSLQGILRLWRNLGARPAADLPDTENQLQDVSARRKEGR
jgi:glycosyltransferase involved in cell wall biosynthesis